MFNIKNINVLVIGSDGMLGGEVLDRFNKMARTKGNAVNRVAGVDLKDLDITNRESVFEFFKGTTKWDWCINCAAYTNTVKAENEGRYDSYAVNAVACMNLADACSEFKTKLLHVSTDYVLSEHSKTCPFPTNNYGMHKLVGELFIQNAMKEGTYCIVRTSWLYGARNSKSFVHKFAKNLFKADCENREKVAEIAQAGANDGEGVDPVVKWSEVAGVDDQFSIPVSTEFLSEFISVCVETDASGILSGVPIASDPVSRYDFARKIFDYYNNAGVLDSHTFLKRAQTDRTVLDWPKDSALDFHGEAQTNIYQQMTGYVNWDSCLTKFMFDNGMNIWRSFKKEA